MPTLRIQHVAFSVTDMSRSAPWYERLFELQKVAEFDEPAPMKIFMTPEGQAIDLRQDPGSVRERFTQTRVGLDHVGFVCADRAELEQWLARLEAQGVEHSGVEESPFGSHLNFRDPDGIALEFFLPAARA
jgi:catechol 2,3-dioxygenase-like lactoylglutathione lyase family enzyme